jgi:hypothetical protein
VRGSRLVHGVSTTYFDEALGVPAINLFSTLSTASPVRTLAMDLSLAGSRPEPRGFLDLMAWAGTPPGGLWSDHLAPLLGFEAQLRWLEQQAELAYDAMYDAPPGAALAGRYSDAKEFLYDAIALAQQLGHAATAERLSKRLAHIKAVFRSQFSS